jgi:hypothetical protein
MKKFFANVIATISRFKHTTNNFFINNEELIEIVKFLRDTKVEQLNQNVIERIKNKLTNIDEKLEIVLLVSEEEKWNLQSLYEEFSRESRISPRIVFDVRRDINPSPESRSECYKKSIRFFKKIDPQLNSLYDINSDISKTVEDISADIIFFQQPWGMIDYPRRLLGKSLTCYLPYSFLLTANFNFHYRRINFNNYLWKYFAQTESHKYLNLEVDPFSAKKIIVSGYPKLDVYFENKSVEVNQIWKITDQDNNIKKLIFAPHWSFSKNNPYRIGTFDRNYNFFLNYAKAHKHIQWIYKPHPTLKLEIVKNKLMSLNQYQNYLDEWNSLPNAKVFESGNYFDIFKTSDGLVTDCASFLGEYLPTQKPIIHLTRADSIKFSRVGESIVENFYKATNNQECENLLDKIIVNQNDYLFSDRMKALKNVLPNKNSAASFINNFIKKEVGLL